MVDLDCDPLTVFVLDCANMNEMGKVLVNLEVEDLGLYQVSLFFCLVRLLTVSHVCWL